MSKSLRYYFYLVLLLDTFGQWMPETGMNDEPPEVELMHLLEPTHNAVLCG